MNLNHKKSQLEISMPDQHLNRTIAQKAQHVPNDKCYNDKKQNQILQIQQEFENSTIGKGIFLTMKRLVMQPFRHLHS